MSGQDLEKQVAALAIKLGLEMREQARLGRRLWGAERRIDVVVTDSKSGKRLGIECKSQQGPGSAQEKIPATIQDIAAWPIPGIVVFSGDGFSPSMRSYLVASGRAVDLEDLEDWLRFFFGLPLLDESVATALEASDDGFVAMTCSADRLQTAVA